MFHVWYRGQSKNIQRVSGAFLGLGLSGPFPKPKAPNSLFFFHLQSHLKTHPLATPSALLYRNEALLRPFNLVNLPLSYTIKPPAICILLVSRISHLQEITNFEKDCFRPLLGRQNFRIGRIWPPKFVLSLLVPANQTPPFSPSIPVSPYQKPIQ